MNDSSYGILVLLGVTNELTDCLGDEAFVALHKEICDINLALRLS